MNYRLIVCVFAVLVCAVIAIEYEDDITDDSIATNAGEWLNQSKSISLFLSLACTTSAFMDTLKSTSTFNCHFLPKIQRSKEKDLQVLLQK